MFKHKKVKIIRPFAKSEHTDEGHFYRTNDGKLYPSITTIFKMVEPFEKTEAYDKFVSWAMSTQKLNRKDAIEWCKEYSKQSMVVGTAMHKMAESYLDNEQVGDRLILDENIKYEKDPWQLFKVLKEWLDENVEEVYGTESELYSDELRLAGTVDFVCKLKSGETVIIDFKNSRKPKTPKKCKDSHYPEQMCAYGKMWEFCTGEKIEYGINLVVSWDLKVRPFKYKLKDYESILWDWILRYESFK